MQELTKQLQQLLTIIVLDADIVNSKVDQSSEQRKSFINSNISELKAKLDQLLSEVQK